MKPATQTVPHAAKGPAARWDRLESAVRRTDVDFTGRLVAVTALADRAADDGAGIGASTVSALACVLSDKRHGKETQAYFLYRAAAEALAAVVTDARAPAACEAAAARALCRALDRGVGAARRAAAEALGSLPLSTPGPCIAAPVCTDPPRIGWKELCRRAGVSAAAPAVEKGRSRAVPAGQGRIWVVKTADSAAGARGLAEEAAWMAAVARRQDRFPARFDVPRPMPAGDGHLFFLPANKHSGNPAPRYAIGFHAAADYFRYPNRPGVSPADLVEILARNALLLGRSAALGMVHTAPIPLFHNRTQAGRRDDRGLYEWPRGGRLDRWLDSSRHPNFGASGLRDFEHFSTVRGGGKRRYMQIGTHLLGLLLVAGSYFRHKDAARVGLDGGGRPVDARDLFDPDLFEEAIRQVSAGYYRGFVEAPFEGAEALGFGRLAGCLIEAMGVDRHMEEILRAADQMQMSDCAFFEALHGGGAGEMQGRKVKKGAADIPLLTGPHLGAFNGRISVPELVEYLQRAAAMCALGRHRKDREAACSGHGFPC